MARRTSLLRLWQVVAALSCGCMLAPHYQRPAVEAPAVFRGDLTDSGGTGSLGDVSWRAVFPDAELQHLIDRALAANNDVRIAAARVLQARAQLTITRADQLPAVTAGVNATKHRLASAQSAPAVNALTVDGTLSW